MEAVKYKVTWKTFLLPLIGIVAFLIYLYVFNVDILEIIATIKTIDLSLYLLGALFIFVETLFYSVSWRALLSFLHVRISVLKSYLYVWYGIYMDIIIPAESISGEITRVYLVTREKNGSHGQVVASLVTHRLMGMGVSICSLIGGTVFLLTEGQVGGLVLELTLFLLLATTIILLLLMLLCVKEEWTLRIIDIIIRLTERISRGRWKLKIREEALKAARMFHDSMKEFAHAPKTMVASSVFFLLSWSLSMSVSYLVFLSLGYRISWSVIIVTTSIVVAVKSIPIGIPFEVGLPEITMTTLYILLGVPASIAATGTVLNRILTLWLRFFVGFASQQWLEFRAIAESKTDNKGSDSVAKVLLGR
jgi:uncharacterized protein (TIRG00374 family)